MRALNVTGLGGPLTILAVEKIVKRQESFRFMLSCYAARIEVKVKRLAHCLSEKTA